MEGIDSGMRLLSIGQSVMKTALKSFGRRSTIALRYSISMHESNTYVMSQVGDQISAVSRGEGKDAIEMGDCAC